MKVPVSSESKFETIALHGGHEGDPVTLSRAVPLYRTTSYMFKDTDHAADLFQLKGEGYIYTRISNPTQDVLEKRLALLEGGAAALALASGSNAVYYSIITICSAGDEILSSSNLYGGTFSLFSETLPQLGISVKFFDPSDPGKLQGLVTDKTRAVFIESIGNPSLDVPDIRAIADMAHGSGLPLIVDSTFTTPYLLRPIEFGADIVVHSLTKWIGGHGAAIGGVVVDAGTFDWDRGEFPLLNGPDRSYNDIRFSRDLGEFNKIAFLMRMRLVILRNCGGCISPDNAWQFLQGIETLALRMERHCANAAEVARFLINHDRVSWVRYPGISDDPSGALARSYLPRGGGGVVVFGLNGGSDAGKTFINSLSLFSHLANVGDAKSLAIHPATTTHSQLNEADLRRAGITPDMVRLSVGIEHITDIIADLSGALDSV